MDQNILQVGQADLQRSAVSSDLIGRIVSRYTQTPVSQGGAADGVPQFGSDLEIAALLASIAKDQTPKNCRYTSYSLNFTVNNSGIIYQVLPQNLNRKFLIVQSMPTFNAATGQSSNAAVFDTRVLFEESQTTITPINFAQLAAYFSRSISTVGGNAGGFFGVFARTFENPVPTSAISIVAGGTTAGVATGGQVVVIEGV